MVQTRVWLGLPLVLAAAALGALTFAARAAAAATYYVDCSAPSNGTGTQTSPWNNLATVSSFAFAPGDTILFKRGTTCRGQLLLSRSGAPGNRITFDSYGTGPNPIIDGNFAEEPVKLTNASYVAIQDLEILNGARWGVFVTTSGTNTVTNTILKNLTVHHVTGSTMDQKWTGLIVFAPGQLGGKFNNVLIDGVTAYDTTLWSGILIWGTQVTGDHQWQQDASNLSLHSSNVTIQNSTVHDVYGDGIAAFMSTNVRLQNNVVSNAGQQPKPETIGTPNAIWTWAASSVDVEQNEAYNMMSVGYDGGAFDADYFSHSTTIQYNYGHDNWSYCVGIFGAYRSTTDHTIFRYNICSADGVRHGGDGAEEIYFCTWNQGKLSDVEVYGNTIYVTNAGTIGTCIDQGYAQPSFDTRAPLVWKNNLVVITSATTNALGRGYPYVTSFARDHNLYYEVGGTVTGSEAGSIYNRDPLVSSLGYDGAGKPTTQWTLQPGSPAINAGTNPCNGISGCSTGGRDFYGHSAPLGSTYDIGADEAG